MMKVKRYRWMACLLICAMMLGMWSGNVVKGEEKSMVSPGRKANAYEITYEWKMDKDNKVICVAKAESDSCQTPIVDTVNVETISCEESLEKIEYIANFEENANIFGDKVVAKIQKLNGNYSLEYKCSDDKCTAIKKQETETQKFEDLMLINIQPLTVESETVEMRSFIEEPPTCLNEGEIEYIAEFLNNQFGKLTVSMTMQTTPHRPIYNEGKEATCTEDGTKEYYECEVCQKKFSDQEGTNEITDSAIRKLGHALKRVPKQEATCTKDGTKEYYECEACRKKFSDQKGEIEIQSAEKIPAIDHNYHIDYTWNQDNTECLGRRVCQNDTFDVTEKKVTSTYAVTKPATYEEDGEGIYIATFEGDIFETQKKSVKIPKLTKEKQSPPVYILTLNINGGILPQQTIHFTADEISQVTLPTPTRKGYVFIGWYDGKNRIEKITEAKDLTLKAQWVQASVDLKYQSTLKWSKYLSPDVKLTKSVIEKKYTKYVKINQKKGTMEGKKYFKKARVTLMINGKSVVVTVKTVIPAPKVTPKKKGMTSYVVGVYRRYMLTYKYEKGATRVVAEYSSKKNSGFKKCGSAQNKLKGASASVKKGTKLYLRVTVYYGKVKSPVSKVVPLKA